PRDRNAMSPSSLRGAQATKQSTLPFRSTMDCFASLAMTVSNSSALSRLLPGIQPGINPALEARKSFQRLGVDERQQLHQDHAGDVARRVDPEIGVGEAGPGQAAGAAAFRRLGGVDQE